ncbi:MAG: S-layer homology domain-containing protein, partial [Oscillospiraceae bacterium]|nr:S-layer homology domain-containing protein [Oscillospiraceae bacterium]
MSKIKKVLSLMLAAAMMLSMMLVPTSAASTFKDADQITYTEEVAITAGLGLFAGADGSFMPKDTVTRAQMATIIIKMLHGSDANADGFKGVSGGFTDTAGFEGGWAEGYINWCASLGIVKGYGDGTFKPGNKVTAAEAVTMILNALKIDAGEGTWPVTVMAKAEEVKFFDDLNTKPSSDKALSREELAVVSLAGLEYSPEGKTGYMYDGKVFDNYMDALLVAGDASKITPAANDTLATKVYELKTAEGFIVANQDTGYDYTELSGGRFFDIETGLDSIGHYVTVYYKELYESEEEPGVTYAVNDECLVVKVDEDIDTAKEYKNAFGKTYSKNSGVTMIDGEYNVSDVTGSIAGYDGGAAAPAGTYIINKGNIVSYMLPVAEYAGYVIEVNTYEGSESILIAGANNENAIPNTEGDDQIREYLSIGAGDIVTYSMAQGIYVVQPADPIPGTVTRTTTNEDGRTVITLAGTDFVAFDGDVSGVAGKLTTNVGSINFGETYELYITMDDEFIGWKKSANSAASLDDIIYTMGVLEISEKDNYGKNVINYKARCVDMNGNEVMVLVGKVFDDNNNQTIDPGEEVLGSTATSEVAGFYTVEDSTDKDAKKEGIRVLVPVPATYDGQGGVFAISSLTASGKRGFFSNGWVPFYNTTAGIAAYGTTGSKYIFVGNGLYDPETDIELVSTVSDLDQTANTYDMLVTRGPNGASNLIQVLIINRSASSVDSGKTVYVTAEQMANGSRNQDGYEYEAYVGDTGALITLTSENGFDSDAQPGFYRAQTDADGITTFAAFGHNETTGSDNDYLRQNMGIQGFVQERELAAANYSDGVNDGIPSLGTNSSANAMLVVDTRSEEQVEQSQTGLIANRTQMFDLLERDPSRMIIADLYISRTGTNNPVVEVIFIKEVLRGTPGMGTVLYSPGAPAASAEDADMIVVKNSSGTDMGRKLSVDYGYVSDSLDVEGFFTYGVNASGELTLERLTVDEAAPGFYGMHNQVTAIDAAAGTLTTEDYHAACDVTCMHANEA